jgi:APA family basic amino acid/polyamine antiporter
MGEVSKSSRVPVWAIIFQGVWASVLALSGTFDQITTYTIFALWLFFGVTASSVFVLRRKMPDAERPYRTLGYPVVPFLFILVAAWLIINTILTSPVESAAGLALIALGLPVYFYFKLRRSRAVR